jgi:ABC-type branched-subunit amino acid transport system ATPase component/ABC-type branched-subunit amino acid transport system permease subunit
MKTEGNRGSRPLWLNYLPIAIVCLAGILISYLIGDNRYAQRILLLIILWAAASSSFNIIFGYGGQVVFGYMMFVGAGAYPAVLLFKFLGISPWIGMWVGVIVAVIIAFIIGLPTLRLHGAFFAIATAAFPLMAFPILNHLGLEELSIPFSGHGFKSMQFRDLRFYVLIGIGLLALVLIAVQMIEQTRFGYRLRALKQNETAAEGMGIDTYRTKMIAFMISAGLSGLMGVVYSFSILYVLTTQAVFGLFIMIRIIGITIVGGAATVWGPLVAACFLVPIGEFLNAQFGDKLPGVQDIIYGVTLIVAILYMPEGIWGRIRKAYRTRSRKTALSVKAVIVGNDQPNISNARSIHNTFTLEAIHPKTIESNANDPIIRIKNVNKAFGGVLALSDLSIEVPRGKIAGIIGPNGSGKTTLFNVINGYMKPEKGSILFEGKEVTHFKPHDLCKLGIGRTYQVAQIFSGMTVLENIMIGAFRRCGNITEARAIAENIGDRMGLSHRAYDQAVGLTILETKMLEFSRALATQPKLLLVDEPMAGLNPEEAERIGEILRVISKAGITVIVIEHVVQSLVKIADWMVGLDHGRKVAEGMPQTVISDPHIIEAYLGTKWRERHAKDDRYHKSV